MSGATNLAVKAVDAAVTPHRQHNIRQHYRQTPSAQPDSAKKHPGNAAATQRLPHLKGWLDGLLLAQEQQRQAQHKQLHPAARQLSLAPV